jgi:hypothetical protein
MNAIQQLCGNCAGTGIAVNWKVTSKLEDGYGTAERVEEECHVCGGKGYTEYAVFTVEEAQAILKHCGIITGEIGDI